MLDIPPEVRRDANDVREGTGCFLFDPVEAVVGVELLGVAGPAGGRPGEHVAGRVIGKSIAGGGRHLQRLGGMARLPGRVGRCPGRPLDKADLVPRLRDAREAIKEDKRPSLHPPLARWPRPRSRDDRAPVRHAARPVAARAPLRAGGDEGGAETGPQVTWVGAGWCSMSHIYQRHESPHPLPAGEVLGRVKPALRKLRRA